MAPFSLFRRVLLSALLASVLPAPAADELKPTFPVPAGFRAEAFAHEPLFANPVAISVDADGSVYVTETRRRKANALDIRQNPDWLNYDLSFTNVAMKEAFYREKLSPERSEQNKRRVADLNADGSHDWRDLTVLSDVIYKLRDTTGDGRADVATIFAEGFNTIVSDVAAGVLARGKDVYATVAPDLWRLTDNDGDGRADERTSLVGGFAVHIAYAGHNMHGVTMGPDGRLYWSIADIASNYLPNEGAIFRCDPDGANFEVFARGLRNPHEFVFNELGDLFTADNDSDNADRERWLHIVEGADYGWRNWWQYQIGKMWGATEDTYPLWNAEGLWHLWFPGQAAWILPPAAHVGPGPCGMKFYPGGALDEAFGNSILLAEFTGAPGSSTVNQFRLRPKGATYAVASDQVLLKNIVATGLDFAPDGGALFIADWAGGWDLNDQGRVWRLFTPTSLTDEATRATAKLLQDDLAIRPDDELIGLLAHNNLNVRREAQFALAAKGPASIAVLTARAGKPGERLPRIHALWALEQIHRKSPGALNGVGLLLDDGDAEIRAQTARMLGEGRVASVAAKLIALLGDSSPRVQFFAVTALGKLRERRALEPIQQLLARTGTTDLYLRYAGIRALELIGDIDALVGAKAHPSPDVRIASAVALRRLERPEVAVFLNDTAPLVVAEAVRAINDVPIARAESELAAISDRPLTNDVIARRVLNANFRLGEALHAERLAAFAADARQTEGMRREAVRLLADWAQPSPRDHVVGAWRPLTPATRELAPVKAAMERHLPGMIGGGDALRAVAIKLAGDLGMSLDGGLLLGWVNDLQRSPAARISALEMLATRQSPELPAALATVLNASGNPAAVYGAGLRLYAAANPEDAARQLDFLLRYRLNEHAQLALAALAGVNSTNLDQRLERYLGELHRDQLPAELRLDVVLAAGDRKDPAVKAAWSRVGESLRTDPLGVRKFALAGGNVERGRKIFFEKSEIECVRCHKVAVGGQAIGGDAAPDLTGVSGRLTREQLLTAIVKPNDAFAPGYEQVVVTLRDGSIVAGRVVQENDATLLLEVVTADEEDLAESVSAGAPVERREIARTAIERRERGLSGMPEGLGEILTPLELRDLIEFLAHQ